MTIEDHFALPVFKMSRLLNKITGLQVTSKDMDGRDAEIPIPVHLERYLNAAAENLRVIKDLIPNITQINFMN